MSLVRRLSLGGLLISEPTADTSESTLVACTIHVPLELLCDSVVTVSVTSNVMCDLMCRGNHAIGRPRAPGGWPRLLPVSICSLLETTLESLQADLAAADTSPACLFFP